MEQSASRHRGVRHHAAVRAGERRRAARRRRSGTGLSNPVTLGIILGLVIGKPLGITLFSWAAVRAGLAALPRGVSWRLVHGVAWLGGIGFTMSLFIAGLAFANAPDLLTEAKLGVLIASIAAGLCGGFLLWRGGSRAD